MLILKLKDVEIVKIPHPKTQKLVPILGYQGIIFRPIKTFEKDRRQAAIDYCRQFIEDRDRACVVLEESWRFSLWAKTNLSDRLLQTAEVVFVDPSAATGDELAIATEENAAEKKTIEDLEAFAASLADSAVSSENENRGPFERDPNEAPLDLFSEDDWEEMQAVSEEKFAQEVLSRLNARREAIGRRALAIVHPGNTARYQQSGPVSLSYRDGGGYTYGFTIDWFRYVAFGLGKKLTLKIFWDVIDRQHDAARAVEDNSIFPPTNALELNAFFSDLLPVSLRL